MKQLHTDMIYDILEEPNLSEEAKAFFKTFLKYPENGKSIIAVGILIADFLEAVSEAEAESILQSLYKAKTEDESEKVLKDIQQKMELYVAECQGMA